MLHRILLPVDGSPLAERAIPLAATLAQAHSAEVVVARIVQPPAWMADGPSTYLSADIYGELYDGLEQEAEGYLETIAERFQSGGIAVRTEVRRGAAAAALLDLETELRPDLVVMSTHGRTGLARFALGSIADLMVREGCAPVLLIRAFSRATSTIEGALVPLDGSPLAEAALPLVEMLAGKPVQRVRLLRAVAGEQEATAAAAYLEAVARRLRARGLQVDILIEVDDPGHAIERAAAATDLVILSTHGRGGLDRLRHGSVVEQATRRLGTPTLLTRARATATVRIPIADIASALRAAATA